MNGDQWYFAYGSNLFVKQKEERTGPIRQAIRCRLSGFRLAFNKRGEGRKIYANIVPDAAAEVWGIAYLCDRVAIERMDRREKGYEHMPVTVLDEGGKEIAAFTYVAEEDFVCEDSQPESWYLDRIIEGAKHHSLPREYIAHIERLAMQSCP